MNKTPARYPKTPFGESHEPGVQMTHDASGQVVKLTLFVDVSSDRDVARQGMELAAWLTTLARRGVWGDFQLDPAREQWVITLSRADHALFEAISKQFGRIMNRPSWVPVAV